MWHSKSDPFWQPPKSNDSTTKYHGSTFIVYNNTIQVASTVNGTYTVVKKRDAQAMDSDITSSSCKRQRTGRGFVNLGARGTAQMRTDMGPSAEDLSLDVRGGARNLLWDRRDFALDVSRNGYNRVKGHVVGSRSVIHHDTNPPPSTNIKLPGSFNKSQLSFKRSHQEPCGEWQMNVRRLRHLQRALDVLNTDQLHALPITYHQRRLMTRRLGLIGHWAMRQNLGVNP